MYDFYYMLIVFSLIAIMLGRFHMTVDECIDKYLQLSSAAFQPKRSKSNILGAAKDKLQAKGAYRSETLAKEFKKVSKVVLGSEDASLLNPDTTCRVYELDLISSRLIYLGEQFLLTSKTLVSCARFGRK